MARTGVLKGQPFRLGTFDKEISSAESSIITFISDHSLPQTKSAPPISRVKADEAFISADLALSQMLCKIYFDPVSDFRSHGLWECVSPTKSCVVLISRQYVIGEILNCLPAELDDARKKLESRKLLIELESAWNSSIIQPRLVPALFCAQGWNPKTKTLHPIPYRSLPAGRIESVVNTRVKDHALATNDEILVDESKRKKSLTGLIYKTESYPDGSFNVDLSAAESPIMEAKHMSLIYVIYIDNLGALQGDSSWPNVLDKNISQGLSEFIKNSNLLVIDSITKLGQYQQALGVTMKSQLSRFDRILPTCSLRNEERLKALELETMRASDEVSSDDDEKSSVIPKISTELDAIPRAFQDLYPAFKAGDSIPMAVLGKAFAQFEFNSKTASTGILLSGRADLPQQHQKTTELYLAYGQLRNFIEQLFASTSRRLLVRKSDIEINKYNQLDNVNGQLIAKYVSFGARAKSFEVSYLGLQACLGLLRNLRDKTLENPYKLAKLVDAEQLQQIRHDNQFVFTIIALEDY